MRGELHTAGHLIAVPSLERAQRVPHALVLRQIAFDEVRALRWLSLRLGDCLSRPTT